MTGASEVDAVDSLYHKQQAETASSKTQTSNNTNCWFPLQTELTTIWKWQWFCTYHNVDPLSL